MFKNNNYLIHFYIIILNIFFCFCTFNLIRKITKNNLLNKEFIKVLTIVAIYGKAA